MFSDATLEKDGIPNYFWDLEHPLSPDPPQSSPPPRLILDISRLLYAARSRTPKGIPRVELAYAEHFMTSEPDRLHFTMLDPLGRLQIVDDRSARGFHVGDLGRLAPRLLVIGERGWIGRDVIESLEEGARLDGCLHECSRLPDATVTGMLKGAHGLLLPSLPEGYGLPLAAALTCGTPVLCSDIPVLRQAGGGIPDYIDPTDAAAWRQAVLNHAQQHSLQRQAHLRRLGCWSRPTWEQHFDVVDTALSKL